jgi:hypothetical protein
MINKRFFNREEERGALGAGKILARRNLNSYCVTLQNL